MVIFVFVVFCRQINVDFSACFNVSQVRNLHFLHKCIFIVALTQYELNKKVCSNKDIRVLFVEVIYMKINWY